ncbi:S8 family peptidase [Actinacidiphila glaucinigra]
MAWIRLTAAISTGLLLTAGGAPSAFARPTEESVTNPADAPGSRSASVRLITGDRVTVTPGTDGRRIVSVDPGQGREGIVFRTFEEDGGPLTVLPSDATDLVAGGSLDRRLFEVTNLIAQGYDEDRTSSLPLIVSAGPRSDNVKVSGKSAVAAAATADRIAAFNVTSAPQRRLDSIGARSLRVEEGELGAFWTTLNRGDANGAARVAATPRIWLDGKVAPVLDRSTAQINAPTAWKAGYEGQGVKVAVLDTGADSHHPDLTGRIAGSKDFSDSSNTEDHFGHGTHVAATVGGTGAASSGTRRGVAPKADLLIGKVLGDDGAGSESQVIDGMEWAVAEHAKVVNMSLGADMETDGTDPMSQAVNALTASSDALFVVAAGNAGPGPSTVGSPGAADAALTVGAVDRDDSLADFSSRGPRFGDQAVKPDVTAPGVGIVAARAAGTTLGTPIDANYVAASGTSMATPHVAGAAALLAQQHPDWGAQQLKDALISTAHTVPGTKVTEQGGGRIDLATAAGALTATGTVTLPALQTGGTGSLPQAATLHYTNTSDRSLDLTLSVALATETGRALPGSVVAPHSTSVHLAPGAAADVPLRTDAADATRGNYYGYIAATSADGTVLAHTTVSLVVRAPLHRLTVVSRDRDGKVMPALPTIWGADGYATYTSLEPAVAEVEEGTYQLNLPMQERAADGQELVEVVNPQVKVTRDMTVTLDVSRVTKVEIRTPRPAEQHGPLSYSMYRNIDGKGLNQSVMAFDVFKRIYVSPTDQVTDGEFEFASRWQMTAPQLRAKASGAASAFTPYYVPASPVFDDKGVRLTAVDAGAGTAAELKAARVRGKLAVIRFNFGNVQELAQAAADAGATALMFVMPESFYPWTVWVPEGERLPLPVVRAGTAEGTDLLERARKRTITVEFTGTVRSPYLYDVMQVSKGRVPERVVYTVSDRNSAVVNSTYTRTGTAAWGSEQRFGWRPSQPSLIVLDMHHSRYVPLGHDRVEYVSAGDTLWRQTVHHNVVPYRDIALSAGMQDATRTYRPGQHSTEEWFAAPVRPSIPHGVAGWPASARNGDTMSFHIPEFTDSGAGHWSFAEHDASGGIGTRSASADDVAHAELFRNGHRLAESDNGAWGDFEVPSGEAGYRLDLSTVRNSDDWQFSTSTETSWTFRSDTATRETLLPLLQVDYSVAVDQRNAVGPQRTHSLGIDVRMPDGLAAPRGVKLNVEVSYDNGKTWTTAHTDRHGDTHFTATVERPSRIRGDANVTLRVTATDATGNGVRQTINRAYLHPGNR